MLLPSCVVCSWWDHLLCWRVDSLSRSAVEVVCYSRLEISWCNLLVRPFVEVASSEPWMRLFSNFNWGWHLLKSAVEISCWGQLFEIIYEVQLLSFSWGLAWSSSDEIVCRDRALRSSAEFNYWNYLCRPTIKITCRVQMLQLATNSYPWNDSSTYPIDIISWIQLLRSYVESWWSDSFPRPDVEIVCSMRVFILSVEVYFEVSSRGEVNCWDNMLHGLEIFVVEVICYTELLSVSVQIAWWYHLKWLSLRPTIEKLW